MWFQMTPVDIKKRGEVKSISDSLKAISTLTTPLRQNSNWSRKHMSNSIW